MNVTFTIRRKAFRDAARWRASLLRLMVYYVVTRSWRGSGASDFQGP